MSDKKIFIEQIERLMAEGLVLDDEAQKFFDNLKKENLKPPLTEKGKTILSFMQKNVVLFNNVFKAKDIADGLGINGKSVSGSMKKLVLDGYVEKIGANPVCYSITDIGKDFNIE